MSFIDKNLFNKFKFDENLKISEDAELAMRMLKKGHVIKQVQDIKTEHIKKYNTKEFIKSEFMRGKRFSRLLLRSIFKDKKESGKKTFYLKPINFYANVGILPFLLLFLLSFLIFKNIIFILAASALFLLIIAMNLEFWNYLRKNRGWFFWLKCIFISFFDMFVMDLGISVTLLSFLIKGTKIL